MIAIAVTPHQGQRDLLDVLIDDEGWRVIHTSVFGRKPDFPKSARSLADWEEEFARREQRAVKTFALRQLARKSQTTMELTQTLAERHVSDSAVKHVLVELQDYFDDNEWVARFIVYQTSRGQGPNAIRQKLRRKGIGQDLIEEQIRAAETEQSDVDVIRRLLATTFKRRNLSDYKERQKVIGTLVRRGFPLDAVFQVLNDS